ncbi:MAG TPA: iron uptake transporter deferrochelatase/peroxidase subunit [Roseiarcus sp.]|nr:iron uptake transporter deferrochelatase/peroxidase subunit [Roseiarcus sp.]
MSERPDRATRRGFLSAFAGAAALAGLPPSSAAAQTTKASVEPFYGAHQAGIVTPVQTHAYFAAFDLTTAKRGEVAALLRDWSQSAARLTIGEPALGVGEGDYAAAPDATEMSGLDPARLTITFGFGTGLFEQDGRDRFGLKSLRPEAFVELPKFPGDQLAPARTGGDLLVQICADNPQVAFHAGRALAQRAYGVAALRWVQSGFVSNYGPGKTPRNLMGFKDGTANPRADSPQAMNEVVWAGAEAPVWMRGGSYVVVRRARMALEHWERTKVAFQEQTFGRDKLSGAPLGRKGEFDAVDLAAVDKDGNPIIPENSHVGLGRRATEAGHRILRRAFSYDDGANMIAERWPPWRQGMEFDAGLVFVCFQRDLRTGFIPIFEKMSRFDMLNQFVTNTGGGHWACPGGAREGDYIGRALLET